MALILSRTGSQEREKSESGGADAPGPLLAHVAVLSGSCHRSEKGGTAILKGLNLIPGEQEETRLPTSSPKPS